MTIPKLEENILTPNTDTESVDVVSESSTHSSIDSKTDEVDILFLYYLLVILPM